MCFPQVDVPPPPPPPPAAPEKTAQRVFAPRAVDEDDQIDEAFGLSQLRIPAPRVNL